jgi:hypothetical protein
VCALRRRVRLSQVAVSPASRAALVRSARPSAAGPVGRAHASHHVASMTPNSSSFPSFSSPARTAIVLRR